MIIDVHGHFTTTPPALGAWRDRQLAAYSNGDRPPDPSDLAITDNDLLTAVEHAQLKQMRERGIDLTIFSPRASFMAHHLGDEETSKSWASICNDLVYRVTTLLPREFAGAAMLPQSPGADIQGCLPELRRCITELGFVGVNLNPDPSGGRWNSPPLTDRYWYPLYDELVALDVPAMIHVSSSCVPAVHTTGAYYLAADTTAFMQLVQGNLFADFPQLRFVIPHGGGAVPYHWGRFRGLAISLGRPDLAAHLLRNIWFDTCVYHQPGIDLLTNVMPAANILFASEMIGAVRADDPNTGHAFDDTRRYIDSTPNLSSPERELVFDANARRVYPRLSASPALQPTT